MFKVKIITPLAKVRYLETSILNIVTPQGEMGILSNHMPIVTMISISRMSTIEPNGRMNYALAGGVLFFNDNEATILTDAIENETEIDLDRAVAAKTRAEEYLKAKDPEIDIKRAEIALRKAINRINVKG
jgi:F-type H+-transporting ATPase subunit epsilon